MKKSVIVAVAVLLAGLVPAWAGHFTDILPPAATAGCVPVSNGYDYNCTTDTGSPAIATKAPLGLYLRTAAQMNALTPGTTGQLLICSDCGRSLVCVSSGSTAAGQWVVAVETGTMATATHCQ